MDRFFGFIRNRYRRLLSRTMKRPLLVVGLFTLLLAATVWLFGQIPTEYAPKEDRGVFIVVMRAPEGASFDYTDRYAREMERILMQEIRAPFRIMRTSIPAS